MQDKHNDDTLETTIFSAVSKTPPKSVRHPSQHPDVNLIDIAESDFHMGVFEPIRLSGIWYRQQTEEREHLAFEF